MCWRAARGTTQATRLHTVPKLQATSYLASISTLNHSRRHLQHPCSISNCSTQAAEPARVLASALVLQQRRLRLNDSDLTTRSERRSGGRKVAGTRKQTTARAKCGNTVGSNVRASRRTLGRVLRIWISKARRDLQRQVGKHCRHRDAAGSAVDTAQHWEHLISVEESRQHDR